MDTPTAPVTEPRICTCPIPSNKPDSYYHLPECPAMTFKDHFDAAKKMPAYYEDEKSEETPVERHLTEEERTRASFYSKDDIIERLCAELDSKDGEIQLFSGATEEQRRRAELADGFIKSMRQLLGIKKGESFSIALTMLKEDLAAALSREKGLREALMPFAVASDDFNNGRSNDEVIVYFNRGAKLNKELTVGDLRKARAALAKEDK